MHATIDAPYLDTCAAQLSWSLHVGPVDALASHVVIGPAATVELRVLGASHQVELRLPGGTLRETVACLPGAEAVLPVRATPDVPGVAGYVFDSEVSSVSPRELAAEVATLRTTLEADPNALIASFPGAATAVTAIVLDQQPSGQGAPGDVLGWRSWHVYPSTGEVVRTRTQVRSHVGPLAGRQRRAVSA